MSSHCSSVIRQDGDTVRFRAAQDLQGEAVPRPDKLLSSEVEITMCRFTCSHTCHLQDAVLGGGGGARRAVPAQGGRQSRAGFKVTYGRSRGVKSKPLDLFAYLLLENLNISENWTKAVYLVPWGKKINAHRPTTHCFLGSRGPQTPG